MLSNEELIRNAKDSNILLKPFIELVDIILEDNTLVEYRYETYESELHLMQDTIDALNEELKEAYETINKVQNVIWDNMYL